MTQAKSVASRHAISSIKASVILPSVGGDEKAHWRRQRREGFIQELKDQDHICANYEPDFPSPTHMPAAIPSLGLCLKGLPKPCGVFVFFNRWAG